MRKDIIITALLTFCLTATLFMIATTRSQVYDPWADLNGDGKINILDVVGTTGIYGASGDPTRNVTIARRANKLAYSIGPQVVLAGDPFLSPHISVDGYSKVTVCLDTGTTFNQYSLLACHFNSSYSLWRFPVDEQTNFTARIVKTYDVPNQEVVVYYVNNEAWQTDIYLDVCLIP